MEGINQNFESLKNGLIREREREREYFLLARFAKVFIIENKSSLLKLGGGVFLFLKKILEIKKIEK